MPGPQLTSFSLPRVRRGRPRALWDRPLRPLRRRRDAGASADPPRRCPGRALTSWGPPSVAPPVWRRSVGLQRPLPPPPPSLPPLPPRPQERCPARRRGWRLGARGIPAGAGRGRGGAEPREVVGARRGSSGAQATRAQVVTTLPPGWVHAPGRREARTGRGRWGGRVFGASRTGTLTAHEEEGEGGAGGRCLHGPRGAGRASV